MNTPRTGKGRLTAYVPITIAYLLLFLLTAPRYTGDTRWYSIDVSEYPHGVAGGIGSRLWEFGHLVWRPLCHEIYTLIQPLLASSFGWSPFLCARMIFVAMSLLSGWLAVCFLQAIAWEVTASYGIALAVSSFFLFCNALNTAAWGAPYTASLALAAIGVWTALRHSRQPAPWTPWVAGLTLGLAGVFWFPFVVIIPAALLTPIVWTGQWRSVPHWRWALYTGLIASVAALGCYGIAIFSLGIHSWPELQAWVLGSGHGMVQNRNWVRLLIGLPRCFFYLGEDTVQFKRFALHDPYAPVTIWDLVRSSLWKVGFFYAAAACLTFVLSRTAEGRRRLLLLAFSLGPVIAFALFFEAGSVERYLGLFPFLCPLLAWALYSRMGSMPERAVLWLLPVLAALITLTAYWRPVVEQNALRGIDRGTELRRQLSSKDLLWFAPGYDPLAWVIDIVPLHPFSQAGELSWQIVIPLVSDAAPRWREDFAAATQAYWDKGAAVWLSKRVLSERPNPEWRWVEGDDPRVSWKDVPPYFRRWRFDGETSGPDGFLRLANHPDNHALVREIAAKPAPKP